LSPALIAFHKAAGADGIVDELRDLVKRARRFLDTAELSGNMSQGLAAMRELRETLVMIARATGEFEPSRHTNGIDIQSTWEWLEIRTLTVEFVSVERRPELARRLQALAEKHGHVS
jgi:hypothetical protein